jgi:hypothetical protein
MGNVAEFFASVTVLASDKERERFDLGVKEALPSEEFSGVACCADASE